MYFIKLIFKLKFNTVMFEKYKTIIPDFEKFIECIKTFDIVSIRVNTLKTTPKEIEKNLNEFCLEKVKWFKNAYVVKQNKELIPKTLEHILGYIYVQRLESMLPPLVLKPKKHELILDLCAAPGSKTTQIAEMMKNTGRIIANDIKEKRLRALFSNLERMGVINTSVTKYDGRKFPDIVKFDKILVDAPCTAEGTSLKERKLSESKKLHYKQLKLLERALILCKEHGIVVYSTCTFSPIENELVVAKVLKRFENIKLEKIRIKGIKHEQGVTQWGNMEFPKEVKKCCRFYPHISGTGGFFVAKFRKY